MTHFQPESNLESGFVLDAGAFTRQGTQHGENEDAYCVFALKDGSWVAIVADGMGGRARGSEAARIVVDSISASLRATAGDWPQRLSDALTAAHQAMRVAADESSRMGAAVAVAVVDNRELWLAHSGDVRVYRVMKSGLCARLTRDMTALQDKLEKSDAPELASGEANDADARVLRGFVGQRGRIRTTVPRRPILLELGDRVVMATDGAYGGVKDDTVGAFIRDAPAEQGARALVEHTAGSGDDSTAVVLHLPVAPVEVERAHSDWSDLRSSLPLVGGLSSAARSVRLGEPTGSPSGSRRGRKAVDQRLWLALGVGGLAAAGGLFALVSQGLSERGASVQGARPGAAPMDGDSPPGPTAVLRDDPYILDDERGAAHGLQEIAVQTDFARAIHARTPAADEIRSILQGRLRAQLVSGPPPASLPPADALSPPLHRVFADGPSPTAPERARLMRAVVERAALTDDLAVLRQLEAQLTFREGSPAVRSMLELFRAHESDALLRDWAQLHMR